MTRVTGGRLRRTAVGAVLLLGAGCGIPPESSARQADPDDVPFGLLDQEPSASPTSVGGISAPTYFVLDDRLVEVPRFPGSDDGLGELVEALSAGPTEDEQEVGLSSSLPEGQVAEATTARGVAQVDLRDSFAELGNVDQTLAIAQLVYTLTGQPGIGRVSFTLGGESVEVPRGDGALTTDALARDDFTDVAPER
ncbi:GerMN domain-containing protein [Iamia sp.]|uniref:GerMN domain-containing protein n=1 Tax=Iamia sp. TaxID=2722710 RepID=UPI002C07D7AD|nr:GerMN domain-containing protein [Iamia sp.]HXH56173.1 GerMN domain-containing protein [Iamia sp.]